MAPVKLLVFVGTEGIYHDHEGQGRFLTDLLNQDDQIEADFSRDYEIMANGLNAYDATLFFTDVGHFTQAQEQGLLHFIERGGGFFGLHTADASFRDNAGYHQMLNGFFGRPQPVHGFHRHHLRPRSSYCRRPQRLCRDRRTALPQARSKPLAPPHARL